MLNIFWSDLGTWVPVGQQSAPFTSCSPKVDDTSSGLTQTYKATVSAKSIVLRVVDRSLPFWFYRPGDASADGQLIDGKQRWSPSLSSLLRSLAC